MTKPLLSSRRAMSLIEVIACTAIVAVLIVPIAAVVKTSGRSITRLESASTTPEKNRSLGTWLRDTLRPCSIDAIAKDSLTFRFPDNSSASIYRSGRNLVMKTATNTSVLYDGIESVLFEPLLTSDAAARRVGLTMVITGRDPSTGATSALLTTIANSK